MKPNQFSLNPTSYLTGAFAHNKQERDAYRASFYGGEVKRYLRFARMEFSARKRGALLRRAVENARAAWRCALLAEAATGAEHQSK
jgi:hypothetical protein